HVSFPLSPAATPSLVALSLHDALPILRDPVFNLDIPKSCPGVPAAVLNPRTTWSDAAAYDAQAMKLARMFAENFQTFAPTVDGKDRKSTRRNSSHDQTSYAVFCLKKKS